MNNATKKEFIDKISNQLNECLALKNSVNKKWNTRCERVLTDLTSVLNKAKINVMLARKAYASLDISKQSKSTSEYLRMIMGSDMIIVDARIKRNTKLNSNYNIKKCQKTEMLKETDNDQNYDLEFFEDDHDTYKKLEEIVEKINNGETLVITSKKHIEKKFKSITCTDKITPCLYPLFNLVVEWCTHPEYLHDWMNHYIIATTSLEKYQNVENPYYSWVEDYNKEIEKMNLPMINRITDIKIERDQNHYYGPHVFKLFTNEFYNLTAMISGLLKLYRSSTILKIQSTEKVLDIISTYCHNARDNRGKARIVNTIMNGKTIVRKGSSKIKNEYSITWADDLLTTNLDNVVRLPNVTEVITINGIVYDIGVFIHGLRCQPTTPLKEKIEEMFGQKLRIHGNIIPVEIFNQLNTIPSSFQYGQHRYNFLTSIFRIKIPPVHPNDFEIMCEIIWNFNVFYIKYLTHRRNSPIMELVLINILTLDRFKKYRGLITLMPHKDSPKYNTIKTVWMYHFIPRCSRYLNTVLNSNKVSDDWFKNYNSNFLEQFIDKYNINDYTACTINATSKV